MKILEGKEQEYKEWYELNKDDYGRACLRYAERWVELLEKGIELTNDSISNFICKNAGELSHTADVEGITGFMYGMAVNILSQIWEYGEELRNWHNKKYNYEGEGVINPALISIEDDKISYEIFPDGKVSIELLLLKILGEPQN